MLYQVCVLFDIAISDAVKLINDLLYSATCATMQVNPDAGQSMFAYLYPYAHFVFNAATCVSAWLVVSLAVERYLLVCWPTRTRALTSAARSRAVAGIVVFVMTLIAVPSALRYRTVRLSDGNGTWKMDVELTQLWRVEAFVWFYNWTQSLLRSIIPVIILIVTGFAIVAALRRRPSMRIDDRKVAVRRRIAVMLVVVVVVFVVCIIPPGHAGWIHWGKCIPRLPLKSNGEFRHESWWSVSFQTLSCPHSTSDTRSPTVIWSRRFVMGTYVMFEICSTEAFLTKSPHDMVSFIIAISGVNE